MISFKGKFHGAKNTDNVVHFDIFGPLQYSYPDGYRYVATIQDEYSKKV